MFFQRMIGILFIMAAVAGIIFSLVGLVEIWRYRPAVTEIVTNNLVLVDQTLSTTQDVLTITDQALQTTSADVVSLQSTTQALAQAIHTANPMLDSLKSLTSESFPAAVSATQTSLASAESSALLIDNVLAALTSLPFLPVSAYKPDVPLHTALAQVSTSLDTLIPALATINASLADGQANLDVVVGELTKISDTTLGIGSTLADGQAAIDQYKAVTAQLKTNVEVAQHAAQNWILAITWIMSLVFAWLLVAQMGLGLQGLHIIRSRRFAL